MRINLRVEAGPHEGQVFEFEGHSNFVVGRSPKAHFRLPEKDKYFSRIHFMIEVHPPLSRLMDMGSTNGTLVNGKRVTSADLKDGDLIKAGISVLRVSLTGLNAQPDPVTEKVTAVKEAPVDESGMMTATLDTRGGHLPELIQSLAARPSRPAPSDPVADTCHLCSAPHPATATRPTSKHPPSFGLVLCPACLDESHEHPQPLAGYRVVRELGRGGMGVVYLAFRDADGHRVAVKLIRPAVAVTERETLKFLREAPAQDAGFESPSTGQRKERMRWRRG
jgi:pSer/pThr/pTyr-binding forkhead associated (FHA) protein